jgi:hypothetical protein
MTFNYNTYCTHKRKSIIHAASLFGCAYTTKSEIIVSRRVDQMSSIPP